MPSKLAEVVSVTNKGWNHVVSPFKLPPYTRIMLADVDAGTDTPAAVGKVLAWKKQHPDQGELLGSC